MASMLKVLVFDLDDTLLDRRKQIGPETMAALLDWIQAGRKICIATSRPYRAVKLFVTKPLLDSCEVISLNGAIQHSAGKVVHRASLLGEVARQIVTEFPSRADVHFSIEWDGEHFATNANYSDAELLAHQSATPALLVALDQVDYRCVSKIAIDGLGRRIDDLVAWIDRLQVRAIPCLDGTFLNVVDQQVDKSAALQRVMAERGWHRGDVAVFGDDLPDIGMMQLSDHAVAMENARKEVKAVAHVTIEDCDRDAIGRYVRMLSCAGRDEPERVQDSEFLAYG
ncbi:MAG: Cof-type family hydrolase [Verrucomicrobia bacterium]|nr:Cof-type family hydrolase [Verrucomicrobiota bacterium]